MNVKCHNFDFKYAFYVTSVLFSSASLLVEITYSSSVTLLYKVFCPFSIWSQRIYLLKLLKSQGLPPKQLQTVFTALILARITYAILVWGGHLTGQQRHRIIAFLKRAQMFEFTLSIYCIEESLEKSDTKLFGRLTNPAHCLHPILPSYCLLYTSPSPRD